MGVTASKSAKLAIYLLQDVAHSWFKQLKAKQVADAGPIEKEEFVNTFLDRFFPLELREVKVLEFINLNHGNIILQEYSLNFNQLARQAPHVVADRRSKMSKFVYGVSNSVVKECRTIMLIKIMDISMLSRQKRLIIKRRRQRTKKLEQVALTLPILSNRVLIILNFAQNLQFQLHPQPVLQCKNLEMVIKIGRQALNPRVVVAVLEQILSTRSMVETIRVSPKLAVMYVLDVASQAIRLESIVR